MFTAFRATTAIGHPGLSGDAMLDAVFLILGLALFGVTLAYASACERL